MMFMNHILCIASTGLFIRSGPNPVPSQLKKRHHWFDGHGHLHTVRITQQGCVYNNDYIRTPRFEVEQQMNEEYFIRVGELSGPVGLIKAGYLMGNKISAVGLGTLNSGQANTHTIMFNNKFYAQHESSLPFELRLRQDGSFTSVGYNSFNGLLNFPVSAHPKVI